MTKRVLFFAQVPRGCDVASGPRGSATRAHAAPTRRIIYIIFTYYIYKGSSAFRISEGLLILINRRVL